MKEYVLTEKLIVEGFSKFIKVLEEDTVLHVNMESIVDLFELHIRDEFIKEDFKKNLDSIFSLLSESTRLISDKDLLQSTPLLILCTKDIKIYLKSFILFPQDHENDLFSYNKKHGTFLSSLETFTGYYAGKSKLPLLVPSIDYGYNFQYLTGDIRLFSSDFLSENIFDYLKKTMS